jgi:hypothetical protein
MPPPKKADVDSSAAMEGFDYVLDVCAPHLARAVRRNPTVFTVPSGHGIGQQDWLEHPRAIMAHPAERVVRIPTKACQGCQHSAHDSPVPDRKTDTLIPLIFQHLRPGRLSCSDDWHPMPGFSSKAIMGSSPKKEECTRQTAESTSTVSRDSGVFQRTDCINSVEF